MSLRDHNEKIKIILVPFFIVKKESNTNIKCFFWYRLQGTVNHYSYNFVKPGSYNAYQLNFDTKNPVILFNCP